jgi:hypothetical protein
MREPASSDIDSSTAPQRFLAKLTDESIKFLIDDYKLKVDYLTKHFDRMWTRFSFFLTIELALFGFLGYLLFDSSGRDVRSVPVPTLLGIVSSLLWYIVGAQDRFLVSSYRDDLRGIANVLAASLPGIDWYGSHYVGSRCGGPPPFPSSETKRGLLSWYRPAAGLTHLPAILGLLLVVIWLAIFLMWYFEFWVFAPAWVSSQGGHRT